MYYNIMDGAYYNEIDPYAAQWIRNLIAAGHVAPGEVDERSIEDVRPDDLKGFVQCHFFAGIAVWSHALRMAGWEDNREIWTGSCPCQPFSTAGKGNGFADERHLWPAFHWLIDQRRPSVVTGEQVASKDAEPWIDLVSTDMEGLGYGFGAVAFPAAGVGSPQIRDRIYWMAHADNARLSRLVQPVHLDVSRERREAETGRSEQGTLAAHVWPGEMRKGRDGLFRLMPDEFGPDDYEPSSRVGRLRAYGNAIDAKAAKTFIEAMMDCVP